MKLLVDAHCFDYSTSEGVNSYIKGLYCSLVKQAPAIEIYFAANDVDKISKIFGQAPNIKYVKLKSGSKAVRYLKEFRAIIKEHKIDCAHFQYITPPVLGCKKIVTLHDILFLDYPQYFPLSYRLIKNILFKASAKSADLLLTVSDYSRQRIAHHYGIQADEIFITPNAAPDTLASTEDAENDSSAHPLRGRRYLLYVSRIEPRKNHYALLKAYHDMKLYEQGYDLVFIGRMTIPVPEVDSLMASLPKEEREHIRFIEQVSFDDLKRWYRNASLFVYPSLAEGFGIPPIEAAVCGIPCVCSNATSMADYRFFGDNLIDINDVATMKRRISETLLTPPDTGLIKEQIVEKYNWDKIARNYYNLLKRFTV